MNPNVELILRELSDTLGDIDADDYECLINTLLTSHRVVVVGVGRVMLSMKAWVKRFKHLGIDINYFGSETEGNVGEGDLVIVASSSGESLIPKMIADIAHRYQAMVFYIGCNPESTVASVADYKIILKGKSKFKSEYEYPSKQPMSTLFEQQLYLLGDSIALDIMHRKDLTEDSVKKHHANLE